MKTPDPYKLALQKTTEMSDRLTWKMINNKTFLGERSGYQISITLKAAFGCPYWAILKDGVIIDECFRHPPTKCELTAKAQSERVLNNLLKQLR